MASQKSEESSNKGVNEMLVANENIRTRAKQVTRIMTTIVQVVKELFKSSIDPKAC